MRKAYHTMKLAVIGGDGIGPEVTAEAVKVLRAVRDDIETTDFDLGATRYLNNGELLTDEDLKSLREDRKSTRLNSSHVAISYAVFCLKKKRKNDRTVRELADIRG